jgi:hypothetical protein
MAVKTPTIPSLTMTPLLPRPQILPNRIIPRLVPRLMSYATRVRVHIHQFTGTAPDGTTYTIPEADLVPKLLSNSVDDRGNFHEYYALMRGGDPEAFMDLISGPDVKEGVISCQVSRTCGAAIDIYLDETLIASFPDVTGIAGPWIGYMYFEIPTT